MKTTLLVVSLFCLTPPVTGVGVAGLIAWGMQVDASIFDEVSE